MNTKYKLFSDGWLAYKRSIAKAIFGLLVAFACWLFFILNSFLFSSVFRSIFQSLDLAVFWVFLYGLFLVLSFWFSFFHLVVQIVFALRYYYLYREFLC